MKQGLGFAAACAAVALAAGCVSAESDTAEAEGPPSCRDMLEPGSNVLSTVCMTEREWEKFERDRRNQAQDMTRRMQGFGG